MSPWKISFGIQLNEFIWLYLVNTGTYFSRENTKILNVGYIVTLCMSIAGGFLDYCFISRSDKGLVPLNSIVFKR